MKRPKKPAPLLEAVGYWLGWPLLLEKAENIEGRTDAQRFQARQQLCRLHHAATRLLIDECERLGIDGSPLWSESQICRERIAAGQCQWGAKRAFDTWPEALGEMRYELPQPAQAAITAGEAAFIRLVTLLKLKGTVTRTKSGGKSRKDKALKRMRDGIAAKGKHATARAVFKAGGGGNNQDNYAALRELGRRGEYEGLQERPGKFLVPVSSGN